MELLGIDVVYNNTFIDVVDWQCKIDDLGITVIKAINLIQSRIKSMFGRADFEMVTICHPNRQSYLVDGYSGVNIICDENIPLDTIFILCKSINGRQLIRPSDPKRESPFEWIDWPEYFYRMTLYAAGISDMPPKLAVDMPYLQARIRINGT